MSPELHELHDRPSTTSRGRVWTFVILAAVSVALGLLYVTFAKRRAPSAADSAAAALPPPPADLQQRAHVVFLSAAPATWGRVLVADPGVPAAPRYATGLVCDRVYVAAGHGVCLTVDDAILGRYRLDFFDGSFRRMRSVPLPGYPSRARVSPDGRYGAFTVFVTGHSYAITGFSTRTEILDLTTGKSFGDLETFRVTRAGERRTPRERRMPVGLAGWYPRRVQATAGDVRQSSLAAHRARPADRAGNGTLSGISECRRSGGVAGRRADRIRHPGSIGPCRGFARSLGRAGRWHGLAAALPL
jgi:hypothetical protein